MNVKMPFDRIKALLSCPPILRMPDMVGMFRLMSDTSILAAGAALYQYQGAAFYIVGYNSTETTKGSTKLLCYRTRTFWFGIQYLYFQTITYQCLF